MMRIEAFLRESPMFTVKRAALRFDAVAAEAFAADDLGFMEGLVLAAIFFEVSPSHQTVSPGRDLRHHAGQHQPRRFIAGSERPAATQDRSL